MNERPPCTPLSVYYIKWLFLKKFKFIFEKRPFKLGSAILLSTESSWVMKTLEKIPAFQFFLQTVNVSDVLNLSFEIGGKFKFEVKSFTP